MQVFDKSNRNGTSLTAALSTHIKEMNETRPRPSLARHCRVHNTDFFFSSFLLERQRRVAVQNARRLIAVASAMEAWLSSGTLSPGTLSFVSIWLHPTAFSAWANKSEFHRQGHELSACKKRRVVMSLSPHVLERQGTLLTIHYLISETPPLYEYEG